MKYLLIIPVLICCFTCKENNNSTIVKSVELDNWKRNIHDSHIKLIEDKEDVNTDIIKLMKWKDSLNQWLIADRNDTNIDLSDFHFPEDDEKFKQQFIFLLKSEFFTLIVVKKGGYGIYNEITYIEHTKQKNLIQVQQTTGKDILNVDDLVSVIEKSDSEIKSKLDNIKGR